MARDAPTESGTVTFESKQELLVMVAGWIADNPKVREESYFDLLLDLHGSPENVSLTPIVLGNEARLADAWNIRQCFRAAVEQLEQRENISRGLWPPQFD